MLGGNIISLGFQHSCAISKSKKGGLYVWGLNNNMQLTSSLKHQQYVDKPTKILLKFNKEEYKAKSVYCGHNYTFVIANNKQKPQPVTDEDEIQILSALKEILLKKGTLAKFFGLLGDQKDLPQHHQPQSHREHNFGFKHQTSFSDSDEGERLKTEEAEQLEVPRNVFIDRIERAGFTSKKSKIPLLAERMIQDKEKQGENIYLGDIEDFVIGFQRHHQKLFAFGQGHTSIFAFKNKTQDQDDQDQANESYNESDDYDLQKQKNLQKQYQNEIIIVSRPTVIKFPKYTRPIILVSCGSAHILALTDENEVYSWGCGSYGALGFGLRTDVNEPTLLEIYKDDSAQKITGVACGKYHSLCITAKKVMYSWGCGQNGRLGNGSEEDSLVPRELVEFSKLKPQFISAGESHSAAITDKLKLYTWGNGAYGRLGQGIDTMERSPKLVEDLDQYEITYVSCGAFHTLAVSNQGHVFAFGQGKYGKLGIYKKERESNFSFPTRIFMYKILREETESVMVDPADVIQICAGFNHSMCLTKGGRVYSWGYNGKGLLGRPNTSYEYIPIEIGAINEPFAASFPNFESMLQKQDHKKTDTYSTDIVQVACGQINTVALTNGGEVYVFGGNSYGQLGRENDELFQIKKNESNVHDNKDKKFQDFIQIIRFPGEAATRISYVACGGEHLFAISRVNELFGWGRNDEGQLGIGLITEYISEPALIRDISHKSISQIACGDNYSVAVTSFGEVYVTGSLEGGKLGLGQAWNKGCLLNFKMITAPDFPQIAKVNCGPQHMVAISQFSTDKMDAKDGESYAWGRNNRGQLGLSNKEDQNDPKKIGNAKENYEKIVCGYNFTLGLTTNHTLHFWGNYKYFCEYEVKKDIEEPRAMKAFEGQHIKDITCSYKYCAVLNDKGEIYVWGSYLRDKQLNIGAVKEKEPKRKKNVDPKSIIKFPNKKAEILMNTLSTGPSHSAAVSVKKQLYTWGHKQGGRLGLNTEECKRTKREPVLVSYLNEVMIKNKQNMNEGIRGGEEEEQVQSNKQQMMNVGQDIMPSMVTQPNVEETKKEEEKKVEKKEDTQQILKQAEENKVEEDKIQPQENLIIDVNEIDDKMFEQEYVPQEKLNIISLARQANASETHILLQKILKKEKKDNLDEDSILRFDDEILKDIKKLLKNFSEYRELEKERKRMHIQMQSAFLQRTSEEPFNVLMSKAGRQKGIEPQIIPLKKNIKEMLTILHIHPCYLVNLYQTTLIQPQDFKRYIKEIYSYPNERINYLLLSLCTQIIDIELKQYTSLDDVDFLNKNSIVGSIFKTIFKSQETNIDTICSIASHIMKQYIVVLTFVNSKLLNRPSPSVTVGQDTSFDVTDSLNKATNKFDIDKQSKNNLTQKRAKDLVEFMEEVIGDIVEDEVLYPQASYFIAKKPILDELNRKKKLLGNQENQVKLESLRFSPEVAFLCDMISKKLKKLPVATGVQDELINTKILGMVFRLFEKIQKDPDVYLYPYVKQIKGISMIEDLIRKTHQNNLQNIFDVINAFFRGKPVFVAQASEHWNKEFVSKLNHLQQQHKGTILARINDIKIKSISFKNFENLIIHSLSNEGHTISIRKQSIAALYTVYSDYAKDLTLAKPTTEDPLMKVIAALPTDLKVLAKSGKQDKFNIKLKTRLMIDQDNAEASRCGTCNCIMIQKYVTPGNQSILEKYNPEDSQSLMVQFCRILKVLKDINKSDSIIDFIEKEYKSSKTNANFEIANMLLKFVTQIDQQVKNNKNKINNQKDPATIDISDNKSKDNKIKEKIYQEIQNEAEEKINERRSRRFELSIIQHRIQNILKKKIQIIVKNIKENEFSVYSKALYNTQYGLANHELKHLADAYTSLTYMRQIISFTTSSNMSKNLFKNLRNEQKVGLRAIVKKKASSLIKSQTITSLPLKSLKPIINKCEFIFFEGENQAIMVKLVFRETKWSVCGPPTITSEAILLNFSIDQKDLLDMRKQGNTIANQRLVFANAIEFDHSKIMKIFNEMDRSKSSYLLNSAGAAPLSIHTTTQGKNKDSVKDNKI